MVEITVGTRTLGGLKAYLEQLVEKGRAPGGAIIPLETAIRKVMGTVEGEGWENTSLDGFDLPDTMERFRHLSKGRYTVGSLHTYEVRFNRALNWYNQFLEKPGWFPTLSSTRSTVKPKAHDKTNSKKQQKTAIANPVELTTPNADQANRVTSNTEPDMITYPWPLINGGFATLVLPRQLSSTDAKRMSSFLETYSHDDQEKDAA